MTSPVVLITGASSGIGRALCFEYAQRGYAVAALARRKEKLEQLCHEIEAKGQPALAISADVGVDGEVEHAIEQIKAHWGGLDVAVANAGISVVAPFERVSLDDYRRVFEVNVFGVIRTAQACLPELSLRKGNFAAVGSVNGFVGLPRTSPYVSSKFAVRGFCDAIYHDFRLRGVSVTHIAPGFIESELRLLDNSGELRSDRKDPIPSWLVMPADVAARQMADAIAARRREAVITLHGKVAASFARHAPGLTHAIIRLAGSKAHRDHNRT